MLDPRTKDKIKGLTLIRFRPMVLDIDQETGELRKTAKLRKSGGSTVVTIPPQMLETLDLSAYDEVKITAKADGRIIIRPKDQRE